jgi:hypothetical protein
MMAVEHEQMNTEFKRKQTYHNLVKKNMHDFTRRAKNQILLERSEKMQRLKELNDEMFREMDEATLDTTPKENRRRTTIQEQEVRDNFVHFVKRIVSKDGEASKHRVQMSVSEQIQDKIKSNVARSLNFRETMQRAIN